MVEDKSPQSADNSSNKRNEPALINVKPQAADAEEEEKVPGQPQKKYPKDCHAYSPKSMDSPKKRRSVKIEAEQVD